VVIQWYPGHIAKAEKELQEQLKRIDVVLEVRDARILLSTAHPQVKQWAEGKLHLVICNRKDAIAPYELQLWQKYFQAQQIPAFFTDGRSGNGVKQVLRIAQQGAEKVNARRQSRGMLPRPVRAVVIGFPNVGKSSLINRLLGRKATASANRPGVTKQLQWVRLSDQIELLDSPGVIPPSLQNQEVAIKLAICDAIGTASYDPVLVASRAVELWRERGVNLGDRYGLAFPPEETGASYLQRLAESKYHGDQLRTAQRLLQDFRTGKLGAIALELPDQMPP